MSLIELIAGVEAHEATLTVVDAESGAVSELRERFADRNLRVEEGSIESGPSGFAVLSRDGEYVTSVGVADLLNADGDRVEPGFAREAYEPVLDHLDETMFTSYSKPKMVAASREIEDRAWRVGAGSLHTGFQTLSILDGETDTYDRLARRDDLDVHAYAAPEGSAPTDPAFAVHIDRTPEIRETWFVAYDGDGVAANKCVLLAEEREPERFYGFWSYDPETVDYVVDHVSKRYHGVGGDEGRDAAV